MRLLRAGLALLLTGACVTRATADCTAFVDGRLVLPGAPAAPGTLVLEGQRVLAAGADATPPAGCARVPIPGRIVTAGLIDVSSSLGLSEIDQEDTTHDIDALGTDPIRAAFRAADGYNPRSVLVGVARLGGVTSAVVAPTGGTVSGQAAWVDLIGSTQDEAVVKAPVAMAVDLGGPAGSALRRLRELLEDARQFHLHRAAWDSGASRTFPWSRADLEALRPVFEREIPLLVGADRAGDIEAVLRFAAEESVRVVIRGGAEAHLVADQLAAAHVGVIVDPLVYGPGSYDQLHARSDNAARLHAAGVTVALSTFSGHNLRKLRQIAGNAVRDGLPWPAAVEAITAAPARIFGIDSRGRLVPGAMADVVIWSGDPLEIGTRIEQVWIHGRPVPQRSRQTELLERYRTLPGTPPASLSLPEAGRPTLDRPVGIP
jgi:imidazolonepropionase-like amidohydrolase